MNNNFQNSQVLDDKISIPKISLQKGGGAIKGIGQNFQPNFFSGTGNLTIPFHVSPCRGFEPNIELQYNSGDGDGSFGIGFSVLIPSITRKTEKGIPRYNDSDIFILSSGEELVAKFQNNNNLFENNILLQGVDWKIISYLPRVEQGFSTIELWESSSESYWKVVTKDNTTFLYGKNEKSRIADPSEKVKVFQWLLEEVYDAKGNKIEFSYKQENKDNVRDDIFEINRIYTANKYISCIRYGNYIDKNGEEDFAFEVVFDYGEYNIEEEYLNSPHSNPYNVVRKWLCRITPFSSYKSGFELRTYRLCRNILLFHKFEEELGTNPCLVRALQLIYDEGEPVAKLVKVKETGFRKKEDDSYAIKSIPPIEFTYSAFNPSDNSFKLLQVEDGYTISGAIGKGQFNFTDLYGDGISGFLYSDDNTVLYWRAKGNGEYSKPEFPLKFPIERNLQSPQYILMSLDGDGKLDFITGDFQRGGFYKAKNESFESWQSFEKYPLDFMNTEKEMVDMTGDGLGDILIFEDDGVKYYPSLRQKGFDNPIITKLTVEKDKEFPINNSGYEEETVSFQDMFGDGLSHRVRVRNGSVECWPNLGHGRFGEKVTFGNSPIFGEFFDANRMIFADIDGSGTADIVYAYFDKVAVYLNQGGNRFSDPIFITLPEVCDKLCQINIADVKGNGTTSLIFSSIGAEVKHYCYDFVREEKPYLLKEVKNNIGGITNIQYASSVKYFLEDNKNGRQWRTKLPFPVQVVEKVENIDLISGSKIVTCYKYHDGYYDAAEREFCGFGFVEEWDAETFDIFSLYNFLEKNYKKLYVPPIYTKRWYHTGAWIEGRGGISRQYEKEYYDKDKNAYIMPDSIFDESIAEKDEETIRQAFVALKGSLLREEVYAVDSKPGFSEHPYTVTESNLHLRLLQPKETQSYAVFFVHERETIRYNYERNPYDPRIQHEFYLEVDEFGNIKKLCTVFYPRRITPENKNQKHFNTTMEQTNLKDFTNIIYEEQTKLKATFQVNEFINHITDFRLIGIPYESKSYEISGLELNKNMYFSFQEISLQLNEALQHQIAKEENFTLGQKQSRLFFLNRNFFWNNSQSGYLPIGEITDKKLLHHVSEAVFSAGLIDSIYEGKVVNSIIEQDGGYIFEDGYWWNPGLVQHYYKESDLKFYLPWKAENSFAEENSYLYLKSTLEYDAYCLLPVKFNEFVTEDIINASTYVIDYTTMQPWQIKDINDNISQVIFDPLGMVIATSIFGSVGNNEMGDMDLKEYKVQYEVSFEKILDSIKDSVSNEANPYLQQATSFFFYDLFAWMERQKPTGSISLIRRTHISELKAGEESNIQVQITYIDGFAREAEKKIKVEAGEAFVKRKEDYEVFTTNDRWNVSGRTVYNNKGKPVIQYQPYFSYTADYEEQNETETLLPKPTILQYDPLLRVIRIDTPKEFFSKVEFNPWMEMHFDNNDTILDSDFYKTYQEYMNNNPNPTNQEKDEKDALDKAAGFYNTPEIKALDTMGNSFLDINILSEKYLISYYEFDIKGRVILSIDPRLYNSNLTNQTKYYNFKYQYDMSGKELRTESIDSGVKYQLPNVFGNLIWIWTARNFNEQIYYDRLQRQVQIRVKSINTDGTIASDNIVEVFSYGESYSESKGKNLRGRVYEHRDQSGIVINSLYGLQGEVLEVSRQLTKQYKTEVNWTEEVSMESDIYQSKFSYDVLMNMTSETTPDGSITTNVYNSLGLLDKVSVKYSDSSMQQIINYIEYEGTYIDLCKSNQCTFFLCICSW